MEISAYGNLIPDYIANNGYSEPRVVSLHTDNGVTFGCVFEHYWSNAYFIKAEISFTIIDLLEFIYKP